MKLKPVYGRAPDPWRRVMNVAKTTLSSVIFSLIINVLKVTITDLINESRYKASTFTFTKKYSDVITIATRTQQLPKINCCCPGNTGNTHTYVYLIFPLPHTMVLAGPDRHMYLYWIMNWPVLDSSWRPIDGRYHKQGSCPKASRVWMVSPTSSFMARWR